MDARLQLRVQRYGWDLAAEHYQRVWTEPLAPVTSALIRQARLQPGEHVLDVACGVGELTQRAWQAVRPAGAVLGTDLSAAMVARARALAPQGDFLRVGAEELDQEVPADAFDVVLCGLGLMYMPDPMAALAAMVRRLRPGGRLVASVWGERRDCGWAALLSIVDARVRSEVCPLFFRFGAPGALRDAFCEAGLVATTSQRLEVVLPFADGQVACEAAFHGGPVALAYSRFDAGTRAAVHDEYLRSIAPWRHAAAYHVPGAFVIAEGQRP